jgi:hypothetical protein
MLARACLALGLLLALTGTAEAEAKCKSVARPAASAQTEPLQVSTDQAMSRDQILAFMRRRDPSAGNGYDGVLGITDTDTEWSIEYAFMSEERSTGGYCVWMTSVKVHLHWKSAVHVASELKPGSCMYGVVLTHEQGHVDIDRNAMGYSQALTEKTLAAVKGQSVVATAPDAGAQMLKRALETKLHAAFDTLNAELEKRQKAHDTPEEYAKPAKICGMEENNRALGG